MGLFFAPHKDILVSIINIYYNRGQLQPLTTIHITVFKNLYIINCIKGNIYKRLDKIISQKVPESEHLFNLINSKEIIKPYKPFP